MEEVAHGLAEHLKGRGPVLADRASRSWRTTEAEVRRVGDIVNMLQLPEGQRLYPPQAVTIHRVLDASSGQPWGLRAEADVLVLGDSFSNIYGRPDLGWGESAGFPAQLARLLGRDVDVIARNGSGATETRRELARRPSPLAGKSVLIWEFAARELMQGNWEVVPLPASSSGLGDRPSGTSRRAAASSWKPPSSPARASRAIHRPLQGLPDLHEICASTG